MSSPIVAVVGPTATGKSALAHRLAREIDGEIVNADALQVYRGDDVGTAKPTPAEREEVPYHLIDIHDPGERYSAGDVSRRARERIAEIEARGRSAIVVGGSGLYLRALWSGLAPLPPPDPVVRRELEERLARDGIAALAGELRRADPTTAGRLGARDAQRILRALEVRISTGRPLSNWIARTPFGTTPVAMRKFGLTLPRAVLYDRIEKRAREMMKLGWMEEIEALLVSGVDRDAPAFQAIGYAELLAAIDGRDSREGALEKLIRATRRFAKRQETWFRREDDIHWWDARVVAAEFDAIVKAAVSDGGRGTDE
ncbi:MAG: tRNA (adenosine(37)-N6)-dimethylallyltransferase MiaA [Thermoanaerobaculia bacterium]